MISMNYQDLKIWQKGMELVDLIYEVSTSFPKEEMYALTSQIRRSATSVPSNIAEGSQRTSAKDFGNFLLISKGSLAELETQLLISFRRKYCTISQKELILNKTDELHRMIYSFYNSILKEVPKKI